LLGSETKKWVNPCEFTHSVTVLSLYRNAVDVAQHTSAWSSARAP
jgi:hypothetical protein